jgi:hypothetical protein
MMKRFFKDISKKFYLKIVQILSGLLLLALLMTVIICWKKSDNISKPAHQERNGTAVLMTGAAARIPQEAALLEELYDRGLLKNVVFISGVSSGALNAIMLNGILSGKLTWAEYKDILFGLKNSDIFIQEGKRKLPVNTNPERMLIKKIVEERLNYHQIGDLPFMTEISITNLKDLDFKKKVYRMCSRKINEESDTTLSLVDIMMASSAFPIAFPPVRIANVKTIPDIEYIDGGVGADHVPYQALLEFEKFRGAGVERVYIISRKNDSIPEVSEELKGLGIDDKGRFDKLGISLDNIIMKGIIKSLEAFVSEAPEMKFRSYVYIPEFEERFLMFNFDNLKEQFTLASQWAKNNDPVPLNDFLLYNKLKRKK